MFFILSTGTAQEKRISIGIGYGAAPVIKSIKNALIHDSNTYFGLGIDFYVNFLYNLGSNFSIGAEFNYNWVAIQLDYYDNLEVTSIIGYLPKVKYKFKEARTRLFLGLSAGPYHVRQGHYDEFQGFRYSFPSRFTFGFAPEFGFNIGRVFQFSTAVHFTGNYKNNIFAHSYQLWQFNIGWNINLIDKK